MQWMFEVVFDYDEGHYEEVPLDPLTEHQHVLYSLQRPQRCPGPFVQILSRPTGPVLKFAPIGAAGAC